ncbi:hypothetical protein [Thermaurantiacus tibetensis]|uniref:hypothetical protein n=1 Tax=Thermaurantiacus tibetensis TaxID=2759035 RepID=UPI00188E7087|nr:hypothetical protein [Thermaurantiacus tibetensis]
MTGPRSARLALLAPVAALAAGLALGPAAGARPPGVAPVGPAPGNPVSHGPAAIPGCSAAAAAAGRPLPFGCANALNLEAMLARPEELARPADLPPPVGEHAIRATERLRRGETPLPPATATGPAAAPGGGPP